MIREKWFFLYLLLILTILFGFSPAIAANWGSIFIDYPFSNFLSSAGKNSSIAIDSVDKIHIIYYDDSGKLKYATNFSGKWVTSTLDSLGDVGSRSSITIDSHDVIHISYFDSTNFDLKYATNISGEWLSTTVDSLGRVGTISSITSDSSDRIHIGYSGGQNSNLKYAVKNDEGWNIRTLDTNSYSGSGISIAADSLDNLHISYVESNSIYQNFQLQYNYHLKYITNKSGEWIQTTVYTPPQGAEFTYVLPSIDTSIAIDESDSVHISYHQPRFKDLIYATNNSGSWSVVTLVEEGDTGFNPSICVDSINKVHISYFDKTNGILKYIGNSTGTWVNNTVDGSRTSGVFSSIALDSLDVAHISYASSNNTSCFDCGGSHFLKYANNTVETYQISAGDWSFNTSRNWVTGHQNCLSDTDIKGKVTIKRNGKNISALFDDIRLTGMFERKRLNLSASFLEYPLPDRILPEPNVTYLANGLMTLYVNLTAASNTSLSGTITWLWVFDENLKCNGGSNITLSAINVEAPESNNNSLPWLMLLLNN